MNLECNGIYQNLDSVLAILVECPQSKYQRAAINDPYPGYPKKSQFFDFGAHKTPSEPTAPHTSLMSKYLHSTTYEEDTYELV